MSIEIDGVLALLPHRGPMLLVDRVVELVPGERVVAHKAVSYSESWYRRLPADVPTEAFAYPQSLLMESLNQACGVLVMATWNDPTAAVLDSGVPMLGSYTGVSVGKPVFPGHLIEHRVRIIRAEPEAMALEGESTVGGEPVLTVARGLVLRRPVDLLRPDAEPPATDVRGPAELLGSS